MARKSSLLRRLRRPSFTPHAEATTPPPEVSICAEVALPQDRLYAAAERAVQINPQNAPVIPGAAGAPMPAEHIAVYTSKRWQNGSTLTVGFLEPIAADLRDKILSYLKLWEQYAYLNFVWTQQASDATIRVTLQGSGYWSYLGTDALMIPRGQATMCLQAWHMGMPQSEWDRVPPHEMGHALGSPHGHARQEILDLLSVPKTCQYYQTMFGWPPSMTMEQVFTPLDESLLIATPEERQDSIMVYQFPGVCTKSGEAIPGGAYITVHDGVFMSQIYPGRPGSDLGPPPVEPPAPVEPPPSGDRPTESIEIGGPSVLVHVAPTFPAFLKLNVDRRITFAIDIDRASSTSLLFGSKLRPIVNARGVKSPQRPWTPIPLDRQGRGSMTAPTSGTYELRIDSKLDQRLSVRLISGGPQSSPSLGPKKSRA